MRILNARISTKALREGSDPLVPHQRAVQSRGAAFREKVGNGIENSVVRAAVVGPVVALDVNRLRHVLQHDAALGVLRRLRSGGLVGIRTGGQPSEIFLKDW